MLLDMELGDFVIFQGFENGATGLMCVGAVAETAVLAKTEYLTEIMGDFGALKIEGAKATDAGSVNDVGPSPRSPYFEHLGEGGRMLSHLVCVRYLGSLQVHTWEHGVDE